MRKTHAAQHVCGLGELNVRIADDLDPIAPRIQEIEKRAGQGLDARVGERLADGLLVVDHQAEVTAVVGRLGAAGGKRYELVAHVDERHAVPSPAAQLELEYAPVPRERLLEVPDLEGHVIYAHQARHRHRTVARGPAAGETERSGTAAAYWADRCQDVPTSVEIGAASPGRYSGSSHAARISPIALRSGLVCSSSASHASWRAT